MTSKKRSGLLSLGERERTKVLGIPKPDLTIMEEDIRMLFGKEKDIKTILELKK